MTSIQSNYGLTAQGNQYQKATTGQKIGKFLGAIPGAGVGAFGVGTAAYGVNNLVKGKSIHPMGLPIAAGYVVAGVALAAFGGKIGKMLGGLIDNQTNKERMAQADGEAAREQRLAQNA